MIPDPITVGRPHPLVTEILTRSVGGGPMAVGGVLEILPGMQESGFHILIVHSLPDIDPEEREIWTRGSITTSLCEIEDTIFVIHQSAAGNIEMPYEPRLMTPEFRPKPDLLRMTLPGGERARFMITYILAEARDFVVQGLRGFTWNPEMTRHFARLYTEKASQPAIMDKQTYVEKLFGISRKMTIKQVLSNKLSYSKSEGADFIPFMTFK